MKKQTNVMSVLLMALISIACSENRNESTPQSAIHVGMTENPTFVVDATVVKRVPFSNTVLASGKVMARNKASLYWTDNEVIEKIYKHNGDLVKRGEPIASMDSTSAYYNLQTSELTVTQAKGQMSDLFIGQGYAPDGQDAPDTVRHILEIKSGYRQAVLNREQANIRLKKTRMTAPFSGRIASLSTSEYNRPIGGQAFCEVIDYNNLCTEFEVIETEIAKLAEGDRVKIKSFADPTHTTYATIDRIDPIVSKEGMIKVQAKIEDATKTKLLVGMNVRVEIEAEPVMTLVVPKEAVVLRQGRDVIFSIQNGVAMWNYVDLGTENTDSYVLLKGLAEGDSIIIGAADNLVHNMPVNIRR